MGAERKSLEGMSVQISDVEPEIAQLRFANVIAYAVVLSCGIRISESWGHVIDVVAQSVHIGGSDTSVIVLRAFFNTFIFTTVGAVFIWTARHITRARQAVHQSVRRIVRS